MGCKFSFCLRTLDTSSGPVIVKLKFSVNVVIMNFHQKSYMYVYYNFIMDMKKAYNFEDDRISSSISDYENIDNNF